MEKKRKTIRSLIAMKIKDIKLDDGFFYFYDTSGKVAFQVHVDWIFDREGTYFSESAE